jgi:hypothetical protein
MRLLILFILLCGIAAPTWSQYSNNLVFGVKAGFNQSSISQLSSIFVSEDYYAGYSFNEKKQLKPSASLFVNYRINSSRIALEGQVSYFQQATQLVYSDIKDFTYTTQFQYHYLGVGGYIKSTVFKGFNIGVGMRMGINLSPDKISYSSNSIEINWAGSNEPHSDQETQDELKNVIKGLNSTEFGVIASYEFNMGISIDFSYYLGLNDMVETLVNRHDFINSKNNTSSMQLTIGYAIAMDQSKKDKQKRK